MKITHRGLVYPLALIALLLLVAATVLSSDSTGIVSVNGSPHVLGEIMMLLDASDLMYSMELVDDSVELPSHLSDRVLSPGLYISDEGDRQSLLAYRLSDEANEVMTEAEAAFGDKQYGPALEGYRKALELQPDYFQALVMIGDVFYMDDQYDSAAAYFQQAIDSNFFDYQPHWFLADVMRRLGEDSAALREMTIAHVLNINHPQLMDRVRTIRADLGRPWKEWKFDPIYSMDRDSHKINIRTTVAWSGYAMVKALWKYEPDYALRMTGDEQSENSVTSLEEIEALISAAASNKELSYVEQIADDGFIYPFIFYELFTRRNPEVPHLLGKEYILLMADYVDKYH